ncbi:MAG: GAF domain-containing protein, partial [Candidatus Dormibacteraeota bacterium]|nr:GAF domain-containing protein [Candidatus Dormibacteraeota bacterium]
MRPPLETTSGLPSVLRGVVADMQHASGADIVSIFLYEEATRTYYAPFATGQPQESLLDSLADMREQLARYLTDAEQGKVPDELGIHQYGSTVWLTVTRQKLVARDAPSEIDSTFIRRYQVQSTIGLPLLAGDHLLGLVYLNYRTREQAPDDYKMRELERRAVAAATVIQAVLAGAERTALEGLARLTSLLTTPVGDARTGVKELRRLLSIALADLLMASNLDGAAIYQFAPQGTSLELVTAHLRVAAPVRIDRPDPSVPWESALSKTVAAVTAEADLHPVATYALGTPAEPHGFLVVLSRDRLATVRRAPPTDMMLKAGAELIGGALASQRLIGELENTNRLLGALGDMTSSMLKPGSSRHEVIDAVVGHLTDVEVPEFDFNFATVYLLEEREDGAMVVRMAAGAATGAAIEATETAKGGGARGAHARIPRWALEEDRLLADDDVLVYVARAWQTAIVGPLLTPPPNPAPSGDHVAETPEVERGNRSEVVAGGIPVPATWVEVPVVRSDGSVVGRVLACLIGSDRAHEPDAPPFTLAGEVFERGGHKDLIRIFLPFGSDQSRRATGVLEVGYHRSYQRRPDWGQVEALRAAAAQVAV